MVITLRRHKEIKNKKGHLVTCKVWDIALYVCLHCSILKIFNIGRLRDTVHYGVVQHHAEVKQSHITPAQRRVRGISTYHCQK